MLSIILFSYIFIQVEKQIPILFLESAFPKWLSISYLLFHRFNGCLKNVSSIYGLWSIYTSMKW